jgi:ATP-dependent RNA helicase RhlE
MNEFDDFGLHADLLRGVAELGFTRPTPIQRDAIPPVLAGRDVLACAMTGSGKTAAFMLPILHRFLERPRGTTRCLVLTPTRELAAQVAEHIEAFAKHTELSQAAIFGGVAMGPQERAFRAGADILVATPGRLLDHMQSSYAGLDGIEVLVLDEADRMLDMGFLPDVRRILEQLPPRRQNLLFSATLPPPIVALAREMLANPVAINIERKSAPATGITQAIYPAREELKPALLLELLRRGEIKNVLVFTRTKHRCNRLADYLARHAVSCDRIHGNRSQAQRTDALARFKAGTLQVLVATDIAARGIDVEALSHVINFDVPNVPEDYIHRVGRTARAEATGDAFTFVAPEEQGELLAIERALGRRLPQRTLADFDYDTVPSERFEIPLGERIAAIRARKSEERARARAKAERKTQREAEESARRQQGAEGTRRPEAGRGRGAHRGGAPRGASQRPGQGPQAGQRPGAPAGHRPAHGANGSPASHGSHGAGDPRRPAAPHAQPRQAHSHTPDWQRRGGEAQRRGAGIEPPRPPQEPKWLSDPEERLKKALSTFSPRFKDRQGR